MVSNKPSKAAVRHVRMKMKAAGTFVKGKAYRVAARRTANDSMGTSTKYDYAGDGKGTKDKDFGSTANNSFRIAKAVKRKTSTRANVSGASKRATGAKVVKKGTITKAGTRVLSGGSSKRAS